jgi:hypothetical protein
MKNNKQRPTNILVGPPSEWTDFHGLQLLFGIRRSYAYHLVDEGLIKSVSLRQPGEKRGKRLFAVDSVRQYLSRVAAQEASNE